MAIARGKVEAVVAIAIMMAMVTPSNVLRCHLFSRSTEQRLQNLAETRSPELIIKWDHQIVKGS
jgi:hypothetical protein